VPPSRPVGHLIRPRDQRACIRTRYLGSAPEDRLPPARDDPEATLQGVRSRVSSEAAVSSFSFEWAVAPGGSGGTTAGRAPEIGDRELFHRMTTRRLGSVRFVQSAVDGSARQLNDTRRP
jgi:hypothetical protein